MNGIPKLDALRSISLYGLSSMTMNFEYDTDPYFAREQAFERIPDAADARPASRRGCRRCSVPSGLIYRYVLQSPDRSAQDLKILQDWVLERRYRAIQGVADDSSARRRRRCSTRCSSIRTGCCRTASRCRRSCSSSPATTPTRAAASTRRAASSTTSAASARSKSLDDIGNIVVAAHAGIPVYGEGRRARSAIGHAPRLGQFGYMQRERRGRRRHPDARRRAGAGHAEEGRGADRDAEPDRCCRPTSRSCRTTIAPISIQETTKTVERNLVRGMLLVLVVLGIFLFSVRTALIVAVTIPFALLFSFICLDWAHIPANLLSIGAIDFGMIVDGAVVMVENIFRELAARHGEKYDLTSVIRAAAKDVERPIFYAIAVIIAGYLPIYVLTGPSGRLFRPMADTMAFALAGSLLCSLTLLPVLCAIFLRKHVKEPSRAVLRAHVARLRPVAARVPVAPPRLADGVPRDLRRVAAARAVHRRRVHAAPRRRRALDSRDDAVHDFVRGGVEAGTPAARHPPRVSRRSRRSPTSSDVPTTAPIRSGSSTTSTSSASSLTTIPPGAAPSERKQELTDAIQQKLEAFPGIIFNYTQPAEDAVDEAETGLKSSLAVKIFGADLAVARVQSRSGSAQRSANVPGITHITVVRELGQPSLTIEPDRAKIARYGLNVADINALIETAVGGSASHAGDSGGALVRSRRPAAGAVPPEHGRDQEHPDRDVRRPASAAQSVRRHQREQRRVLHLSRDRTHGSSAFSSAWKGRDLASAVAGRQEGGRRGRAAAGRLHVRLGRRVQGVSGGA